MPYSVWLTSHRRYEDVRAGAPDRLTPEELRACLDLLARSRPILRARRPDGATWVFRAGAEPASAPLLWAGVRPNNGPWAGTLQLSVSGTSAFLRGEPGRVVIHEVDPGHGDVLSEEQVTRAAYLHGASVFHGTGLAHQPGAPVPCPSPPQHPVPVL